ncbi:MAG TPA: flagellar basal-body MS-ring/collar protein FliF [Polyangiaceae bacterium]|nr:flagellar basal-body MS-ring/collar protein FliF [Polyangiaceae bacterium]
MADANPNLAEQVKKFWLALSRAKKIALVTVTLTVLLGVVAVALIGSRVHYAPLYTGLSTEDSAAIVARLKELKIDHRVTNNGIEVPEENVPELRLELASSGLPRGGGVGFEIFDTSRFGATEFEQQVNLRRALEGELARSINTIEGVMSARVHLVLPERWLFAAKSEGASASVVVKLRSGSDFGKREVAGIVHLVSSAVPALSKDRVSVVSTDGITLHSPSSGEQGGSSGLDETQSQLGREIASNMESHVRTLLERVTGPGGVDVRINVDLEDASRERTEEHYEPTRTALRSEHKTEETTTQEAANVAGVPGAQSNLPDVEESVAARGDDLKGNIFRRTRTRNWEVDRVTEKTVTPRGDIARVSAAVLIDGTYETKDGVQVYHPRDPEELSRLAEVVKNAIGFNAARGDSIRVEGAKFSHLDVPEPEPKHFELERQLPLLLGGLGVLTLIAMLAIFWRVLRAQSPSTDAVAAALGQAPGAAPLAPGATATAAASALDAAANAPELPPATPAELEHRRTLAIEFANKDPAGAALILSRWLGSGDEIKAEGEASPSA